MFLLKKLMYKIIRPNTKWDFVINLPIHSKVLDVGCGSHGSTKLKSKRKDLKYVGIDIGHYNFNEIDVNNCDEFILTTPEEFDKKIGQFDNEFDAIISNHNLEHCNNYIAVVLAMIKSLKKNGKIYIAFPAENSVHFPARNGSLNFYDDTTHINLIQFNAMIQLLKENGLKINYKTKNYQPIIPYLIGFILEPISKYKKTQMNFLNGTWAYYGFETIIIAEKV